MKKAKKQKPKLKKKKKTFKTGKAFAYLFVRSVADGLG